MNPYVIMLCLFMALAVIVGIIKIVAVFKRAEIEKKRLLYEKLLKEARTTRITYIKLLETSDDFRIKLDGIRTDLGSKRSRLNSVRSSIREILQDARTRLAASHIDKLEANVIVQKKINIGESWKVLDNFRRQYNKKLAAYRLIENEDRLHSNKLSESGEKWEAQKTVLMGLYDELKVAVDVPDPRSLLATNDK